MQPLSATMVHALLAINAASGEVRGGVVRGKTLDGLISRGLARPRPRRIADWLDEQTPTTTTTNHPTNQ